MKIKCVIVAALIALSVPFLSGCDYVRIHERLMIHAIGIDLVDNQYQVSVHTVSLSNSEESIDLWQATGTSVLEALNDLTLQNGQEPMYSQNLVVVFGKSCAENGLNAVMDFFVRHYDVRPNVQVFLAEDAAEDIFKVKKNEKYVLPDMIRSMVDRGGYNGKTALVMVKDVVSHLYDNSDPYMPILKAEGDTLQIAGTAVFQTEFLKDILTPEQTKGISILTDKLQTSAQVIQVENGKDRYRATLFTSKADFDVKTEIEDGKPVFTIQVHCSADIESLDDPFKDEVGKDFYDLLSKALSEKIQQQIQDVIDQTFFKDHCDIFRLGRYLMKAYPDYWREHSESWHDEMAESTIKIEVNANVVGIEQEITPKL